MSIELFDRTHLAATPWKNGGGTTREIVRRPVLATSDACDWRVSIAELTRDGPFSIFTGYDRIIVLLDGDGVRLQSSGGGADGGDDGDDMDHRLTQPLTPFAFSGDHGIYATLIGSASSDFNVMTRRAAASARVRICRASERVAASQSGVLFAAHGHWRVTPADAHSSADAPNAPDAKVLRPNTGLWWDGKLLPWAVRPQSRHAGDETAPPALLVVSIQKR